MPTEPQVVDDIVSGAAFRDTLLPRADQYVDREPLWHGWAIMDAYLSGLKAGRADRLDIRSRLTDEELKAVETLKFHGPSSFTVPASCDLANALLRLLPKETPCS